MKMRVINLIKRAAAVLLFAPAVALAAGAAVHLDKAPVSTDPAALPGRLSAPRFDVGVIAGTVSFEPWFSAWLPGPDDGKVAVSRTRLEGMRDFITVPHGHTFIMNGDDVARATIAFLRTGSFGAAPADE